MQVTAFRNCKFTDLSPKNKDYCKLATASLPAISRSKSSPCTKPRSPTVRFQSLHSLRSDRKMSDPIVVSDEEDDRIVLCTPTPVHSRKRRIVRDARLEPAVLFVDVDDLTPLKSASASVPASTPSFVAETPMSDIAVVKCTGRLVSSGDRARAPEAPPKCSG